MTERLEEREIAEWRGFANSQAPQRAERLLEDWPYCRGKSYAYNDLWMAGDVYRYIRRQPGFSSNPGQDVRRAVRRYGTYARAFVGVAPRFPHRVKRRAACLIDSSMKFTHEAHVYTKVYDPFVVFRGVAAQLDFSCPWCGSKEFDQDWWQQDTTPKQDVLCPECLGLRKEFPQITDMSPEKLATTIYRFGKTMQQRMSAYVRAHD